jgi:hypothetical protein
VGIPETALPVSLSQFHSLVLHSLGGLLAFLACAQESHSILAGVANLGLLVIDDLSTPVLAHYPTGFEEGVGRNKSNRLDPTTKRNNVLKELANKLAALAIKKNISVFLRVTVNPDPRTQPTYYESSLWKQREPSPRAR